MNPYEHPNRSIRPLQAALAAFVLLSAAGPVPAFEPADVRAIVRNKQDPNEFPGFPAVIMAHQTHRRWTGNGSGYFDRHVIVGVFDPDRAEDLAEAWEIDLDRRLQFIEVFAARRYRGDEVMELGSGSWEETAPPGLPEDAYELRRRFRLRFPEVEAGDVLEVHYRVHILPDPERYPVLWGVDELSGPLPTIERQILFTIPTASRFHTAVLGWEGKFIPTYQGDTITHDYHTGDLPAISGAEMECGDEIDIPRVVYSTSPTWSNAGYVLIREFKWSGESGSVALRDSARAVTRNLATTREKVAALLEFMGRNVALAPRPSPLLRYWPRKASESFEAGWADTYDWVGILRLLCSRAGLPSEVTLVAPRPGAFRDDIPCAFQFPNVALSVRLADESREVLIDPLREPAGLAVRPYPGELRTFMPKPLGAEVETEEPLEADETFLTVDLFIDPATVADGSPWTGRAEAEGRGLGAAWIAQRLANAPDPEPAPHQSGWTPLDSGTESASLETNWSESTATASFRWRENEAALPDDAGHRVARLLPPWRGAAPDDGGICPEGPMTVTTRLHLPKGWVATGEATTLGGDFDCGTWRLAVSFPESGSAQLEETVTWNGGSTCGGHVDGLAGARATALGL